MKFKYYKTKNSEYVKGIIDFTKLHVSVEKRLRRRFRIIVNQGQKYFEFKCSTHEERNEWVDKISEAISKVQKAKFDIEFNSKAYWRKEAITASEFLANADSGDILLFRKHSFLPKMQRVISSSHYDHVGMIIVTEEQGERKVLLLESVYYDGGVGLIDLTDKDSFRTLLRSHTKLVYRKLDNIERDDDFVDDLQEALFKVLNKKYGMNFFNFWRKSSQMKEITDTRSFHCAELVAKMYKVLGLINTAKGS